MPAERYKTRVKLRVMHSSIYEGFHHGPLQCCMEIAGSTKLRKIIQYDLPIYLKLFYFERRNMGY